MPLTIIRDVTANRPVAYVLDSDPTTFAGWGEFNAELGQNLYRTDVPSIYFKSGPANGSWTLVGNRSEVAGPALFPASVPVVVNSFTPTMLQVNRFNPTLMASEDLTANLPKASTVNSGIWFGLSGYPASTPIHNLVIHPFAGDTIGLVGGDVTFQEPNSLTILYASDGVSDWYLLSQFYIQGT